MKHYRRTFLFSGFLALAFFVISFFTLKSYGVSWDESIHFARGQAYLYYFLTGKTNYNDLPNVNLQGTFGEPQNIPNPRRSLYQMTDFNNGEYMLKNSKGHPPLNDELAALFNYIFYQKLGVMNDISSHHLFNILASSLLVFVVAGFAFETLGFFSAVISTLALATYPLFWAESHFNIKDPPETAFFAATVWFFWKSLRKGNAWWLIGAFILFGFALGTKFNILFILFILIPYLLFRYKSYFKKSYKVLFNIPNHYLLGLFLGPMIVFAIFFGSWPYLWQNLPTNFMSIISYYKSIGTGIRYQPDSFFIAGFNTFPIQWIVFTTPPFVLLLSFLGVFTAWFYRKKFDGVSLLWILWFFVPILRVTIPGTAIYGGVRQIMEFIPAMALLCGLGGKVIIDFFNNNRISKIFIFLILTLNCLFLIFNLIKWHPNENVYFNFLIGGLKGAAKINFPSWGNSFGNAYFQGIKWFNKNAPENAKLSLVQGIHINVPPILVRKDIIYNADSWSGIERKGEYLMELTFNDTAREFHYEWEYLDNFLIPIYEVNVDGVSILKIWKNDWEHTRKGYQLNETEYSGPVSINKVNDSLTVDMQKDLILSRINFSYSNQKNCTPISMSFVETSADGNSWLREKDWIPYPQVGLKSNSQDNKITYYFAGRKTRMFRFLLDDSNSCGFISPRISIVVLE